MRILATILVTAGVALALLWPGQGRLIYLPHAGVPAPASQGLSHAEVVTLSSDDGVALEGWFVPAASTPPRFTVIMFNGNAGNRGMRAPVAAVFARRGVATLLFDYQSRRIFSGETSRTTDHRPVFSATSRLRGTGWRLPKS